VLSARAAEAASHRVAAVHPDPELVHALEVALLPWDVAVVSTDMEGPGATMPMAIDRARAIARSAGADVIVWVSEADDRYALWIYDVESDHASARSLVASPPFEATTAAAVALAVKALLRTTVVAPPPERFGAVMREPEWLVGVDLGAVMRFGGSSNVEGRASLGTSFWPRRAAPWGIVFQVDAGTGVSTSNPVFSGTFRDSALRVGVGALVPFERVFEFESFVGGGAHLVTLDGLLKLDGAKVEKSRVDGAVESRIGLGIRFLDGRLRLEPWIGVTVLTRWQRFQVHQETAFDFEPIALQGALRLAVALP
jgi:hypothetical protein